MNTNEKPNVLSMSRTYAASADTIFEMWSNPDHITNWWGPIGFSTTTDHMNFAPGGTWKFTMHGPDGTDYPNFIKYKEIIPGELISYDHGSNADVLDFSVKVTFSEEDGKTHMNFEMTFVSGFIMDAKLKLGAREGLTQTLSRLDDLLREKSAK